tara:strand:- start:9573 stop:12395 length:2823 start_codon:yes stop_codon:yes gene_type:complete
MKLKTLPLLILILTVQPNLEAQIFDKIKKTVGNVTEKVSLKKLQRDPVSTSFSDVDKSNTKPISFGDNRAYTDIFSQPFTNEQGFRLSPGYYEGSFDSFCIKAGTYAPSSGSGRFYAELDGPKADIFETILHAFEEGRVEKQDAQLLFWAIIAKTDFSKMKGSIKATALRVLSTEEIARLSTNALENLGKKQLRKLSYKSNAARAIIEAENNLRSKYYNAVNSYAEYEEIAMLAGAEPVVNGWESGKWTQHPDGYYLRYYPSGYQKTKTQIYVPENTGTVYFNGFGDVAVPAHTSSQRLLQSNRPYGGGVVTNIPGDGQNDDSNNISCTEEVGPQIKFNKKIDNDAHAKIEEWVATNTIKSFSFAPNGGWVLISKSNEYVAENIPSACREKLQSYQRRNICIKEVVFPPNGGNNSWLIITENGTFSKNIPPQCYERIKSLEGQGKTIQSVAFPYKNVYGSGESWVILTTDGKHYTRNIPDECYQIMRNIRQTDMPNKAPDRKITKVSFSPSGGWFVIAEDYYFSRNLPGETFNKINEFKRQGYSPTNVVFDPDNEGWSVISTKINKNPPQNRIRSFERDIVGRGSIWNVMRDSLVPGVTVAVVIDGKLAWKTGYGHLQKGNEKYAAHPESMFQAASISKAIAAIGVFKLIDENKVGFTENLMTSDKLDWDIPFHECVKDSSWASNFNLVRIDRILQHTSGITGRGALLDNNCNYIGANSRGIFPGGGYGGTEGPPPTLNELLQDVSITYHPTSSKPNNRGSWYSGQAFTILQKLTEDITEMDYPYWMRKNILEPMNMDNSGFIIQPENKFKVSEFSRGHNGNGTMIPIQRYSQYAAAGLYTSAEELANVLIMVNNDGVFDNKRVLSTTSIRRLIDEDYGFNVSGDTYFHGGTNAGFRALFTGYRNINKDGIQTAGIVVLTNGDNNIRQLITDAIEDAYGW